MTGIQEIFVKWIKEPLPCLEASRSSPMPSEYSPSVPSRYSLTPTPPRGLVTLQNVLTPGPVPLCFPCSECSSLNVPWPHRRLARASARLSSHPSTVGASALFSGEAIPVLHGTWVIGNCTISSRVCSLTVFLSSPPASPRPIPSWP